MNTKLILTFVLGALLAGGVMYVAVGHKNETAERPQIVVQSSAPVTPAPQPDATAEKSPTPAASAPEPTPAKPVDRPHREVRTQTASHRVTSPAKPSPMPVSQPAPQQTAQNRAPAPVQDTASNHPANDAPVLTTSPVPPPPGTHVDEPVRPTPPPPRQPQTVTIPAGTLLTVRLDNSLSSSSNDPGDAFRASLDAPLVVDNAVIAERGSHVQGRVVDVDKGGRVSGVAHMSLELTTLNTSDGQKVRVQTESFQRQAEQGRGRDAAKIGAAAGLGAAIGAIAGGGKGAAIGAVVGGAAGTGGVMATRGKAAEIPAETRISFRLAQPVTVTEKIQ